jgi:predicted Zn finger-like uncharacterized protein
MAVITCPQCNYSRSVPDERIPPRVQWVRCPRCGARFEFVRKEGDEEATTGRATPWEQRTQRGLWNGVTRTIRGVLFSPRATFSKMPVLGGWRDPLAFGLLVGSIGSMFGFFWEFMAASMGFLNPLWSISGAVGSPLVFLLLIFLSPLFVMVNLLLTSIIFHVLLSLVRGGRNGYEATFRVVAYSQATRVWSLIPLVGGAIGWIWRLIVYIIGLKEVHQTSYGRVIFAFCVPFVLIILFFAGAMIFILHSLGR